MYYYQVYGLLIQSALPLPELPPSSVDSGEVDVTIRIGAIALPLPEAVFPGFYLQSTPEYIHIVWESVAALFIRAGCEIIIDPDPLADASVIRLFVLQNGLGDLLHQRGHLVFHASAVQIGSGVVGFIGESGWGKSTLAAFLDSRGHSLLTDEVFVLDLHNGVPLTWPGVPYAKLWPDSVVAVGADPEVLVPLGPGAHKRIWRSIPLPSRPLPLKRLYVLGGTGSLAAFPLSGQNAILELVRHSYANRLLIGTGTAARHLQQCAQLVGMVPIARLQRPDSLEALPDVAKLVEDDFATA